MSECSSKGTCGKSSCEGCSQNTAKGPQSMQVKENAHSRVKKVIGVVSGKGGVGKSMVTASLANLMAAQGYKEIVLTGIQQLWTLILQDHQSRQHLV